MSRPRKILLSGGLILGSAAYALWQQEQVIPPPAMRQVAEKARQAATPSPAAPPKDTAPVTTIGVPAAPMPPAPQAPKPEARIARTEPAPEAVAPPAAADQPTPPDTPPAEPLNAIQLAPPPAASTGRYADGEFVGNAVDDEWGPVQVKVVVRNGDIADVICIEYPFHRRRSQEISEWAIPTLVEETIHAQSEKIDWVSQASFTSDQFQKSLTSALARAHKPS